MMQRPPDRRRNRARSRGDFHDAAVPPVLHDDTGCIACKASGRFRGNFYPVFQGRIAVVGRVGENRGIDVDDDLVVLGCCARLDAVVQRRLRDYCQRVRLLLGHAGSVLDLGLMTRAMVQGLASSGKRSHEQGADLGLEAPADDEHAVVVLMDVDTARAVSVLGLARLCVLIDLAPAADDPFHVGCGARLADPKQDVLGLRRRDAGECAHLGVGQLAAPERGAKLGQRGKAATVRVRRAGPTRRFPSRVARRQGMLGT